MTPSECTHPGNSGGSAHLRKRRPPRTSGSRPGRPGATCGERLEPERAHRRAPQREPRDTHRGASTAPGSARPPCRILR
eukprot:3471680-Alexandrium_andersonii.AAC.1